MYRVGTKVRDALAQELLAEHNRNYSAGTERESYSEPPVWMVRRAAALAEVAVATIGTQLIEAGSARDAR